jgi:hypothetical protein
MLFSLFIFFFFSYCFHSVTYDAKELIAYTAWENGRGSDDWTAAACNTYLAVDLKQFF